MHSKMFREFFSDRNPIALTGNLGDEVDTLRCTTRPRKTSARGRKLFCNILRFLVKLRRGSF